MPDTTIRNWNSGVYAHCRCQVFHVHPGDRIGWARRRVGNTVEPPANTTLTTTSACGNSTTMVSERCCIHQYDRVDAWIASVPEFCIPLTPPLDSSFPTNTPASVPYRSGSPKRRRVNSDNSGPEKSASQFRSESISVLNERTAFSPSASHVSSSPKRSPSPTRETPIILRTAYPPVLVENVEGLEEAPPEQVEQLRGRLTEGIDSGFIPQGLSARLYT